MFAHISVPTVTMQSSLESYYIQILSMDITSKQLEYAKLFRKLLQTNLPYICTLDYVFITLTEFFCVREISDIAI